MNPTKRETPESISNILGEPYHRMTIPIPGVLLDSSYSLDAPIPDGVCEIEVTGLVFCDCYLGISQDEHSVSWISARVGYISPEMQRFSELGVGRLHNVITEDIACNHGSGLITVAHEFQYEHIPVGSKLRIELLWRTNSKGQVRLVTPPTFFVHQYER